MNKKVGITSGQPLILFLYFLKQGNIVYLSFLIILISKVNISPMLHSNMNSTEKWHLQSNLAISNSVNSKSLLFRRKIECPWIYPFPLRFPGYFEAPLFQTFFNSVGTSKQRGSTVLLSVLPPLLGNFLKDKG